MKSCGYIKVATTSLCSRACSHYAKFCLFCQKICQRKAIIFLVRTIFCTHQDFCKRNETSKIPSTSFGGCKNFVRRENPLFLDIASVIGSSNFATHGLRSERDRMTSRECSLQGQGMRGRAAPPQPRIYRVPPSPRDSLSEHIKSLNKS